MKKEDKLILKQIGFNFPTIIECGKKLLVTTGLPIENLCELWRQYFNISFSPLCETKLYIENEQQFFSMQKKTLVSEKSVMELLREQGLNCCLLPPRERRDIQWECCAKELNGNLYKEKITKTIKESGIERIARNIGDLDNLCYCSNIPCYLCYFSKENYPYPNAKTSCVKNKQDWLKKQGFKKDDNSEEGEEKEGIIKKRVRIKSWNELVEEGYKVFCPSEVAVPYIKFPKSGYVAQMTNLALGRQGEVLISKDSDESRRLVIVENVLRAYCCEEMLVYLN